MSDFDEAVRAKVRRRARPSRRLRQGDQACQLKTLDDVNEAALRDYITQAATLDKG